MVQHEFFHLDEAMSALSPYNLIICYCKSTRTAAYWELSYDLITSRAHFTSLLCNLKCFCHFYAFMIGNKNYIQFFQSKDMNIQSNYIPETTLNYSNSGALDTIWVNRVYVCMRYMKTSNSRRPCRNHVALSMMIVLFQNMLNINICR